MDRNLNRRFRAVQHPKSLSARRAWIEIKPTEQAKAFKIVALRKESVDRNRALAWKLMVYPMSLSARRAWIEIAIVSIVIFCIMGSLSARRAWIEITSGLHPLMASLVALRKESVDRNKRDQLQNGRNGQVALRKESVDRNIRNA